MREISRVIVAVIASLLLAVGIFLIYERGGILTWLGLILGSTLLLKSWLWPARRDLPLCLALAASWLLAWPAIFYYVISTWETGEVVALTIETPQGDYRARTWILEETNVSILYYDASTAAANALFSNSPIEVLRGGQPLSFDRYEANRIDDMPPDKVERLFALMLDKYGERNAATDFYYGFLGRSRDRIGVVLEFNKGDGGIKF